jgi:hypothetical protein
MAYVSSERFRTFHALRIKGFAKPDVLAEIADLDLDDVEPILAQLQQDGLVLFREARGLWQLTPDGRGRHLEELASDVDDSIRTGLGEHYEEFLGFNHAFKALCGEWQLRDGAPNDHSDRGYDAGVIERLVTHDRASRPIVEAMGAVLGRMSPYARRLELACDRVTQGETNMFTGVMCGSYHDIWMELHEDLILSQGIDRAAEGSF